MAAGGTGEQQIGNVGAGDKHYEDHGTDQEHAILVGLLAGHEDAQGQDLHAPVGVGGGKLFGDAPLDGQHLGAHIAGGNSGFQAHDGQQIAGRAQGLLFGFQGQRQPHLDADGKLSQQGVIKTRRGDFPASLCADSLGRLFVANNDTRAAKGQPYKLPGSVAVYDTSDGKEIGRFEFTDSFGGTPNFPLAPGKDRRCSTAPARTAMR